MCVTNFGILGPKSWYKSPDKWSWKEGHVFESLIFGLLLVCLHFSSHHKIFVISNTSCFFMPYPFYAHSHHPHIMDCFIEFEWVGQGKSYTIAKIPASGCLLYQKHLRLRFCVTPKFSQFLGLKLPAQSSEIIMQMSLLHNPYQFRK